MWRYHPDPNTGYLLVSVRRKPRGWVRHTKDLQRVTKVVSHYEASTDWVLIEGWQPVGFNGYVGRVFDTRRAAAEYLVTCRKFWASKEEIATYV